jgi:hypothetical protein
VGQDGVVPLEEGQLRLSNRRRGVTFSEEAPMKLEEERSTGRVVYVPEAGDDHWDAGLKERSRHAQSAFEARPLTRGRAAAGEDDQAGSLEVARKDLVGAKDTSRERFSIWGQDETPAAEGIAFHRVAREMHDVASSQPIEDRALRGRGVQQQLGIGIELGDLRRLDLGSSKARKAWRGAAALVERKVTTPPPIAYLESRKRGFADKSYFLAGFVEDAREIRFLLRELEGEALDRLLRDVAAFLAGVHARGVLHKDLSDGNILVKADSRGGRVFYLLDTNRVRTRKRVGGLARMKNLIRLGIPPDKQDRFLGYYARGNSLPKTLRRWYKFQKAWYAGRINLKKKLRLKQLARKLGIQ